MVTRSGIEGSLVYALSAALRDRLQADGRATAVLDLLPDWPQEKVMAAVTHPRGSRSLSSHLQSRLGLTGVKAGLLRECAGEQALIPPCWAYQGAAGAVAARASDRRGDQHGGA